MRVLAYIRVSSTQQENNSSLEHQKNSIKNFCVSQNLTIHPEDIFTEIDSGANPERKEFNKMREVLKNTTQIKHLIVNSIDRLTRSVYVGEIIAKEVKDKKGSIVSVSQGFDDATPTGKMTRQILTVMAEQERDMIVTRTSNGRKSSIKKGLFAGGKAPFGYKTVGNNTTKGHGQLLVDEKEKRALAIIFRLHFELYSYREISKHLAKEGFLTRKGTSFNPGTIKKIVDNKDFYTGKASLYKNENEEDIILPQHPVILEDS